MLFMQKKNIKYRVPGIRTAARCTGQRLVKGRVPDAPGNP